MSNEVDIRPRDAITLQRGTGGLSIAPKTIGEVIDFARYMSQANTGVPKHLRGNTGNCMMVAMQAFEWGMPPFAVANKSYSVNDRIAYEAQLIAAVVNTRSGLQGRLKYKFDGEGGELRCTVTGILDGEEVTYRSPRFADIHPKNSPLWKTDPEQQLGYYSARAWARRHVPEVILGVYDREEAEAMSDMIDVTPPPAPADDEPPAVENVVDVDPEPEKPAEKSGEAAPAFGQYETRGDFFEALQVALAGAKSADDVADVWDEFDVDATLTHDPDDLALAKQMRAKALASFADADDEPPSLFSDE